MSWLEGDARNIASGWAPEPQLHAPEIGTTLAAILHNRLAQQELTQKSISAAIKNIQTQRQDSAFAQALQNTGLTEGQDVSGLSGAQLSRMAQLLQDRTPDTDLDAMHQAAAARDQAVADAIKAGTYPYRGGGRGSANQVPLTDAQGNTIQDANGNDIMVNPNSVLFRQAMASQNPSLRTPMSPTQAKAYLANVGISGVDAFNAAQHQGFQRQPDGSLAPLTPDQSYDEDATDVKITPSAGGNAVTVPKAVLENIKKALMPGSYTDDTAPNQAPPSDVPPGGGTFPPNFSGFTRDQNAATSPAQPRATPPTSGAPPADTGAGHSSTYGRPLGQSQGGYSAGKTYGGMRYLGGDPNDKNNWQ